MKKFLLLLLSIVVGSLLVVSSASATVISLDNWAFNPDGDGYANSLNPIDELTFNGISFVDNDGIDPGSSFTQLGTFYTSGFANDGTPVNPDGNINGDYELTAVLTAAGNNTSQTGDDVDFDFTSATLNFYIDYTPDYGSLDGFYGADEGSDGTLIASFSLVNGGGNIDFSTGDGNTDIIFELVTMTEGYFFDENGEDLALYDPSLLVIGMTDSNNEINAPYPNQASEWADEGQAVTSGDDNDIWTVTDGSFQYGAVPEPTTMLLFGLGLIGFAGLGRRRRVKN